VIKENAMSNLFDFPKAVALTASILLAGCGGGSGGGHDDNDSNTPPPPPVTRMEVNFNDTVRTLATQPISAGAASAEPMDVNTPIWIFDDADDAFEDVFL
jgi:hypothetical protein